MPATAGQKDELYYDGRKAHAARDYVKCLKNLHTYFVINEAEIKKHPAFERTLLGYISTCEAILRIALQTNSGVSRAEGAVRITSPTNIGGPFIGSGKEINDMLNNGSINLESNNIMQR